MARAQRSKQLQDIIDDVNPITVAAVVDGYSLTAAQERWHWCAGYVRDLAAEGRRMKAAGEKWQRVRRAEEPEDLAPPPPKRILWTPSFVQSSPAPKAAAPAPRPAPAPVAPKAKDWSFPMAPGLLLRKSRTTTIPTLAMMLCVTRREVRDAIEEARRAA